MNWRLTYLLSCLAFLLISNHAISQNEQELQNNLENILEQILSNSEEEIDLDQLTEEFQELYSNRINLNNCSKEELKKLPLLTPYQLEILWEYCELHKPIYTYFELVHLNTFNKELIQQIQLFTKLGEANIVESKNWFHQEILWKTQRVLEKQIGYSSEKENGYLGSPYKQLLKYKLKYGKQVEFRYTGEKDPGESFTWNSKTHGFDHHSFSLSLKRQLGFDQIILGDFKAQFGQGLNLGNTYSTGKSEHSLSPYRTNTGLKSSASSSEYGYFRGIALQKTIRKTKFYLLNSYTPRDASFTSDSNQFVSSFLKTGYHNTNTSLNKKANTNEYMTALHISRNFKKFKLGLTSNYLHYDKEIGRSVNTYQQIKPQGKTFFNYGFNLQGQLGKSFIFTESSFDKQQNAAFMVGIQIPAHDRLHLNLLYRNYSKNYYNFYSSGFGENSSNTNEEGLYAGCLINISKQLNLRAYADFYKFPWLKYQTDQSSSEQDFVIRFDFHEARKNNFYFRFKYEKQKKSSSSEESNFSSLLNQESLKARFHIRYQISESILFQNRFETSNYQFTESSAGWLFYHDIQFSLPDRKIKLYARYSVFDTQDYNSRIYTYENDVLYAYSIPAFQKKGSSFYILCKYSFHKFDFWIKYQTLYQAEAESISSGLNEIQGNRKSEIKFQMRVKF